MLAIPALRRLPLRIPGRRHLFVAVDSPPVDLQAAIAYPYPAWVVRVGDASAVTFLPPSDLVARDAPEEAFLLLGPRAEAASSQPRLSAFRENRAFRAFLNAYLRAHACEEPLLVGMARTLSRHGFGGHVHLHDQRNPPPPNRVGDPDDLIGMVAFDRKGRLEEGSFEPVAEHRLYREIEGMQGLMVLPDHTHRGLVEALRKRVLGQT